MTIPAAIWDTYGLHILSLWRTSPEEAESPIKNNTVSSWNPMRPVGGFQF